MFVPVVVDKFGSIVLIIVFFRQGQIKLKETALEASTNSFLEKEKDLQNKIEELESKMEELNQSSALLQVCNSVHYIMHHTFKAHIILVL